MMELEEAQQHEEFIEWGLEQLGIDIIDVEDIFEYYMEHESDFDELRELYAETMNYDEYDQWDSYIDDTDDEYPYSSFYQKLDVAIKNSIKILGAYDESDDINNTIQPMIYGHVVSAFEGYLEGLFKYIVMSDQKIKERYLAVDQHFTTEKITLNKIFEKFNSIDNLIKKRLDEILFHKISMVNKLFLGTLNFSFDEKYIPELSRIVLVRHDCVHRAGHDKEGLPINLKRRELNDLFILLKVVALELENEIISKNNSEVK